MSKVWFDDDVVELRITVSDGRSSFRNQVYVGHEALSEVVSDLHVFKDHLHSGLLDARFGAFGPEWANGAFHARLHFAQPGKLFITCQQESDHAEFGIKTVASGATLHLRSEPGLLDRFIAELRAVASGSVDEAFLEAS